jgi:hypothetical protein
MLDGNSKARPEQSEASPVLPLEPDEEVPVATLEAGVDTMQRCMYKPSGLFSQLTKYELMMTYFIDIQAQKRKVEGSVSGPQTTDVSRTLALQNMEARLKEIGEDVSGILRREIALNLYNAFYSTVASSPLYDAQRGTGK